jgi:osmotically-inducible protein OsmY
MSGFIPPHATHRGSADQRLAVAVAAAIRTRCGRSVAGLAVVARQGVATLHGRVRGFYQKQVVLTAALAVPGVEQVIDHVEVLPLEPEIPLGGSARSEAHHAA